jgi:hypothetical protein
MPDSIRHPLPPLAGLKLLDSGFHLNDEAERARYLKNKL